MIHYSQKSFTPRLSLARVARMTEDEAKKLIIQVRWASGDGGLPFCPRCGVGDVYYLAKKNVHKCAECYYQFTTLSSTAFSSSKKDAKDILLGVSLFANAAKGLSSLQFARDLGWTQKSAFIFCHKIREAITKSVDTLSLSGVVEIDSATFGGHRRLYNGWNSVSGKRRYSKRFAHRCLVVVLRQRLGRTIPLVVAKERDALDEIRRRLAPGTIIQADGAHVWDSLQELFDLMRIKHAYSFSANGACTNNAESFFSVLRRMHLGTHHKMNRENVHYYASELAWRQDHRHLDADERAGALLALLLGAPTSTRWAGYWQCAGEAAREAVPA
jgi:transposase-like protein